jgi:50S ribosomal protein L16 3-hydroxylase
MFLQRLLGDIPLATFLEQHYLKTPYARPGGCQSLDTSIDWRTVEHILGQPDVNVVIGRGHERDFRDAQPTFAEARGLFEKGFTIAIRHAEKHAGVLASLARDFEQTFRAPVDIQLYCTPANTQGFGWHYDAEEVFVLQMQGGKEWFLRKNTVNPWPLLETMPIDMRYEREIMPIFECALTTHDWLYIPSGYWHSTRALQESISLSVGVLAPTALNVLDSIRRQLLTSLRWRQRLPLFTDMSPDCGEAAQEYHDIFRTLGQDLLDLFASPATAKAFLKELTSNRSPAG